MYDSLFFKHASVALLAATALTACQSPPLDPGNIVPHVIRSPLPSDVAYHRIMAAWRACSDRSVAQVYADYSPTARHATFHYSSSIDDARVELAQIELARDIGNSTVIIMRLRGHERSEFASAVEPWLRGETVRCPYSADDNSDSLRFP